ncbi:MAG TPA: Arc family DNA-binding protein [Beutenbergiaceae bacterium]|nr:Arc family DNA-binding protein [Beutenbergiaceae bacterium]
MNVRLPQAMRDRLDEVASAQGRRPAEVARDALEEYLASH